MSEQVLKLPLDACNGFIRDASGEVVLDAQVFAPIKATKIVREVARRVNAFDALLEACKTAEQALETLTHAPNQRGLEAANALGYLRSEIAAAEKELT